ncbi:MAG: AAA family ATPase [Candidatus Anstonellaceae archaeon]
MPNIFRQSGEESRIFKDESCLLPDFLPQELPGREKEIRELVYCLKPAAESKQPHHALLVGPPGTGKTSSARFVLKQLLEYSQRPVAVYLNCWEAPSRFAVFGAIAEALGEFMPRRGIAADEVFLRIVEIAKKEGKVLVAVLDEVDRLAAQPEGAQVLYDLCRAGELHSLKVGVLAITNDEQFHARLDPRVRSSFIQNVLHFKPYTMPQLKEILLARAKLAFFDNSIEPDVVPLCAAVAYKSGGDARAALSLLFSAGKAAEREGAQKVSILHVRQAQDLSLQRVAVKAERVLEEMDSLDKRIIQEIKNAGQVGIESGRLYEVLSSVAKERAIRNRIDRLEKSGIIVLEPAPLKRGKSRIIRLKGKGV